jgi:hypothetical protein
MEKIIEIVQQKWMWIGSVASIFKAIVDVRNGSFKWNIFLTDLIMAMIVWYVAWELTTDFNEAVRVIFTWILSWNAFVLWSIIFNKEVAENLIYSFFEKKWIDLKSNDKEDENRNNS